MLFWFDLVWQAAPGTAKRKKSRGFATQLTSSGAGSAPKGFGGKK